MNAASCLMLQGTASGVGKTLLTAALCRLLARAGFRVAPFKSQNMALNAAVTADGREIGRAQAAQAEAAGIEPTVDMNPILLKPEADDRSQVVVEGVARGSFAFSDYRLLRGMAKRSLLLSSLMAEAAIWIDGSRLRYDLRLGDRVTVATGAEPLRVLGYDDARRRRLFP